MGSGGSKPSAPAPAPAPRPAPIQQRVIEDPKPAGGDNTTGVSVSGAKECEVCDSYKPRKNCRSCKLIVNSNISTSVVTLTRSDTLSAKGGPLKCNEATERTVASNLPGITICEKRSSPGVSRWIAEVPQHEFQSTRIQPKCMTGSTEGAPSDVDVRDDVIKYKCTSACPQGTYATMESGYKRCWQSGGRSPSAEEGSPRGVREVEVYPAVGPGATGATSYASDKKLIIKPDKPFEVSFSGQKITITQMAIYRPSPIRVENVQADAVLSLNDYSDPNAKAVILLPISAAITYGAPGDFVGRVMQNYNAFTVNESTGKYNPLTVPVGNDWSLTRVLEVADGKNNEVAGGFFKWESGQYERYVVSQSPSLLRYGWRQKPGGITTIMMKEPIGVSYVTSSYLAMLPYAPSAESAPAPAASYTYKAPICKSCKNAGKVDPAKFEAIKEANKSFFNPVDTVKWAIALFFGMAAFVAIYFALEFALKGNGQFLRGIATSVAQYLVMPRKRSATVAPEPTPAQ